MLLPKAKPFTAFLDVDDELFIAPVDMEAAIRQYCEKTGQEPPKGQGEFYRTVMESFWAFQYRQAIHDLEAITGQEDGYSTFPWRCSPGSFVLPVYCKCYR